MKHVLFDHTPRVLFSLNNNLFPAELGVKFTPKLSMNSAGVERTSSTGVLRTKGFFGSYDNGCAVVCDISVVDVTFVAGPMTKEYEPSAVKELDT